MTPAAAGAELERGLLAAVADVGGTAAVEDLASRPWASVGLCGARHRLVLRIGGRAAGAAARAFLEGLADREFELRGAILADIVLAGQVRDGPWLRLMLEALTVEPG